MNLLFGVLYLQACFNWNNKPFCYCRNVETISLTYFNTYITDQINAPQQQRLCIL